MQAGIKQGDKLFSSESTIPKGSSATNMPSHSQFEQDISSRQQTSSFQDQSKQDIDRPIDQPSDDKFTQSEHQDLGGDESQHSKKKSIEPKIEDLSDVQFQQHDDEPEHEDIDEPAKDDKTSKYDDKPTQSQHQDIDEPDKTLKDDDKPLEEEEQDLVEEDDDQPPPQDKTKKLVSPTSNKLLKKLKLKQTPKVSSIIAVAVSLISIIWSIISLSSKNKRHKYAFIFFSLILAVVFIKINVFVTIAAAAMIIIHAGLDRQLGVGIRSILDILLNSAGIIVALFFNHQVNN